MREVTQPTIVRRTLSESDLLQIGYIAVRPTSAAPGEVEAAERNVLALPLAGVFAKHDGPRQHAIATPNHALLIAARKPYRLSFPGCIGDRCLALRFTDAALARISPEAMAGDGFDAMAFATHILLPPALLVARACSWQRFAQGALDPLEAEELGIDLLNAVLDAARRPQRTRTAGGHTEGARRARHVARTLEAIATQPARKWTLDDLAAQACVSPGHLAHVFREETGVPVYEYAVRARLAGALDAVLDSDAGLSTIALEAGFSSHSHFTARFRALFGYPPAALRCGLRGATARQLRRIATARALAAA